MKIFAAKSFPNGNRAFRDRLHVADMNPDEPRQIENDPRHADWRHPVDEIEPLAPAGDSNTRACEALSRTFIWIADAGTLEQIGLRATVVLHTVREDLIEGATLEEIGHRAGCTRQAVENLLADFRATLGWR